MKQSDRITSLLACLAVALSLVGCGDNAEEQGQALLEVAERGDLDGLEALLGKRAAPDYRDSCQWTPLMKAALNGHQDAVERLLAAGASIDAQDSGGYTALLLAASNDHADIVAILLAHGAMIDHQEQTQGFTALIWAAQRGHQRTVAALLRQGADKTLPDFAGRTAADHATEQGFAAIQALLAANPPT